MKKFILPIVIVSIFSLLMVPVLALAAPAPGGETPLERLQTVGGSSGLPATSLEATIGSIINVVFGLVGVILVCLIVYAGFLWMTAGGGKEQVEKATSILKNAIIGLIITVLAYSISLFVMNSICGATGSC